MFRMIEIQMDGWIDTLMTKQLDEGKDIQIDRLMAGLLQMDGYIDGWIER